MTEIIATRLGPLRIHHPPGTFAPSPASRLMVEAITGGALDGGSPGGGPSGGLGPNATGVDWGCGTGALTIAAARLPGVRRVLGLDRSAPDVEAARVNARENGVESRTAFFLADGFEPADPEARAELTALRGSVRFVVANPPASRGDDGFAFRPRVLAGARDLLAPGGVLLMQILSAYGPERVRRMVAGRPGFAHEGVVATTPAVPLDLDRPVLRRQLRDYEAEEGRGGLPYRFEDDAGAPLTAREAAARHRASGAPPRARWQAHSFRALPTP